MGVRIPKNQIQDKKYTAGKEYMFETTYREYQGYYYEVNGKLFAGKEITTNAPVLIPIKSDKVNTLLTKASTYVYGVISNNKIKSTKVLGLPKSDIDNLVDKIGETFLKFYCQSTIDSSKIKEVDEATFNILQDDPLYKTTFIGTHNGRTQTLDQAEKQIPNISLFIEPISSVVQDVTTKNISPQSQLFAKPFITSTQLPITGSVTDTPKSQDIIPVGPIYEKGAIFIPPPPTPPTPPSLRLIWEDIIQLAFPVNVVSNWNDFFNLPNQGNQFTSVDVSGNEVRLFGGSSINIQVSQFKDGAFTNARLVSIIDECNCVISINEQSFAYIPSLETVFLPAVIYAYGQETFAECTSLKNINLKSCIQLGLSVGDDLIFLSIGGNTITLTIPSVLMTCNSGNPDGDIQYLQDYNNVTIITV